MSVFVVCYLVNLSLTSLVDIFSYLLCYLPGISNGICVLLAQDNHGSSDHTGVVTKKKPTNHSHDGNQINKAGRFLIFTWFEDILVLSRSCVYALEMKIKQNYFTRPKYTLIKYLIFESILSPKVNLTV